MMQLVLAASVLALAAATHPAPRATPAPPRHVETLRADVVSGNGQTVPAYAAIKESKYIADFKLLVVRVTGAEAQGDHRRIRFHCVTKGCIFASVDQPDDAKYVFRIDPSTYDARAIKGKATLAVSIEADQPAGTYTVRATPNVVKGERAVGTSFTLTMR